MRAKVGDDEFLKTPCKGLQDDGSEKFHSHSF